MVATLGTGEDEQYVDALEGVWDGFDAVLAVRVGANIDPLNADELAARAIDSDGRSEVERGPSRAGMAGPREVSGNAELIEPQGANSRSKEWR